MSKGQNFLFFTLGCKINQYETQALKEAWQKKGWQETDQLDRADIVCINSCAVTARAVQDLRKIIRKTGLKAPQASLIVTGCAAQVFENELNCMPEVHRVVPQKQKPVLKHWPDAGPEFSGLSYPELEITDYSRSRAVLKVQDGCSHKCTYCIVPYTRGASISRPVQEIIKEARQLLAAGLREIIISGINLHQFGRDLAGNVDFWDLLSLLESELAPDWAGRARIRLSSLEPSDLTDKAFRTLAKCRMVCPHLHISMQSASTSVLKKMGRGHYGPEQVKNFLKDLQTVWPVYALGADILLGFPGESRQDFLKTMDFCNKLPFSYAHVFAYSPRPNTEAVKIKDQLSPAKTKARSQELRQLLQEKKRIFYQKLVAEPKLSIILEKSVPLHGMSEYYVPCYLQQWPAKNFRSILEVKPVQVVEDKLWVAG